MFPSKFSFAKLTFWLLVSSLVFINARVIPASTEGLSVVPRFLSENDILAGRDEELMQYDWPIASLNPPSRWTGRCWRAYVEEPENSGWTQDTILEWAQKGYESAARIEKASPPLYDQVVSAFWVPGNGVYLSTIVKRDLYVSTILAAPEDTTDAPRWRSDDMVNRRINIAPSPRSVEFHAEDGAIWFYESHMKSLGTPMTSSSRYPQPGTQKPYMASFGKRESFKKAGAAKPCRNICQNMLTDLGIAYNMPDETLNQ